MVKIRRKNLKRKASFKLPVWAVSLFAVCTVLLSYGISGNTAALQKAAYLASLTVMPEGAFFAAEKAENTIYERLYGEGLLFFQKSVLTGENEDYSDLKETPADIAESMESFDISSYDNSGIVQEKTYGDYQATSSFENVFLRNVSKQTEVDIEKILNTKFSLPVSDISSPVVLIYHSHSTETYCLADSGTFSADYPARTDSKSLNMIRIGDEITKILKANGIGVIHDRTICDSVYSEAYERSRQVIEKILNDNKSIVITLDIHRDAIYQSELVRIKPTADIEGKKAAQLMIITGVQSGNSDFPDWESNLSFALRLQQAAENKYEGLMRPILFAEKKYNMDITPYSLLIEVGTDVNTLDEAAYSGRLLGDVLSDFIKEYNI